MSGGHGPYGGGPAAYGGAMPRPRRFSDINANWGWVVVACLCFWPLGFAAASAAGRVVPALLDGDAGRAQDEAGRARKLGIVALCITVGLLVLFSAWLIVSAANGTFDCPTDDPYC